MKQAIVLGDEVHDTVLHKSPICKDRDDLKVVKARKELAFRIVDADLVVLLEIDCEVNIRNGLKSKHFCLESLEPTQTQQVDLVKFVHLQI